MTIEKGEITTVTVPHRGGMILTCAPNNDTFEISDTWPKPQTVHETVPERAKDFLSQAIASLHAPAGAVMLSASAVDAMLKDKEYSDGSLYSRIEAAATDHVITNEMATWAHEIRLDSNDERHAGGAYLSLALLQTSD